MSRHLTPTAHAEEAYQAQLNAKFDRAMKIGPAGVKIPPARQLYRKTVDGPLLSQIIRVSYADYRRRLLPRERWDAVSHRLWEEVIRRFPVEEMKILDKYNRAFKCETAAVELLSSDFVSPEHIRLPEPVLVPVNAAFHVDLGGRGASIAPPVPDDTIQFFRDVLTTRREKRRSFEAAHQWVGEFRTKEGRFPYWSEMERAFPLIGEWMEGQRS